MTGICTGGGGSAGGYGTIFKITTTGTLSTLHSFDSTGGAGPAGLVQATDGNFYGTTNSGGLSNGNCLYGNILGTCGTVFKMTPTGTLTTLHGFNYTDGGNSGAALVQGSDGNIYRTTSDGGSVGSGTVFKITPTGTLTTVHNFNTGNGDDAFPGGTGPAHQRDLLRATVRGGKVSKFRTISAPPTVARSSVCLFPERRWKARARGPTSQPIKRRSVGWWIG